VSSGIRLPDAEATRAWGQALAGVLRAGDIVVVSGELGAGKTTLAQGVGRGLGVRGPIASPTFVIARLHPSLVGGPALVHVDAYRLESLDEVDALDLDALLPESVVFVEWGENMVEHLSADRLEITLTRPRGARTGPSPAGNAADDGGPHRRESAASGDPTTPDTDPHPTPPPAADDGERIAQVRPAGPRWANVAIPTPSLPSPTSRGIGPKPALGRDQQWS